MAYAASGLVLWAHGNDRKLFQYNSSADTMATIAAAGYFHNVTNANRMVAGDLIWAVGSDASGMLKVSAVTAAGSVTTLSAGAGADTITVASTASTLPASGTVQITSTAAQAYALPAPVPGQRLTIIKTSSSTAVQTLSSTLGGVAATIGLAGVTITWTAADQSLVLEGVTTTRWQTVSNVGSVSIA